MEKESQKEFRCSVKNCQLRMKDQKSLLIHIQKRHPEAYKRLKARKMKRKEEEERKNMRSETNFYDLDSLKKDAKDMQEMSQSLINISDKLERSEMESNVDMDQEYFKALARTEMEKQSMVDNGKEVEEKTRRFGKKLLLQNSYIDGDKVEVKKEARLELIDEIKLEGKRLRRIDKCKGVDLSDLKSLEMLYVGNNYLESISGFKNCFRLLYLDISDNRISDISGFEYCYKLETVKANKNLFKNLDVFDKMESLKSLDLQDNKIANLKDTVESMKKMNNLEDLVLKGNPCARLLSYAYEVVLAQKLKRLDGKKVLGADIETAKIFKKNFLLKESRKIDMFSKTFGSNFYQRPTTAPSGGKGLRALVNGASDKKKFVSRFERIKEEDDKLDYVKEEEDDDYNEDRNKEADEIRYDILKREFEKMKDENSELRHLLDLEKGKAEELEMENSSLKIDVKIYKAQAKSIEPILKENEELKTKVTEYETDIKEGSIEYYKRTVNVLNGNVKSYLDEITRLRGILYKIKKNGGLEDIRDKDLDSINMHRDEVISISPQRSVRTRDLSIRARVNKNIKKGKVEHAKLYGKPKGTNQNSRLPSLDNSIISNNNSIASMSIKSRKRPPRRLKSRGSLSRARHKANKKILRPMPNDVVSKVSLNESNANEDFSDSSGAEFEEFINQSLASVRECNSLLQNYSMVGLQGAPNHPPEQDKRPQSTRGSFYDEAQMIEKANVQLKRDLNLKAKGAKMTKSGSKNSFKLSRKGKRSHTGIRLPSVSSRASKKRE